MFQQNSSIPMQQLDALMNIDNVYGMDEIIGDPIHAINEDGNKYSTSSSSSSSLWGVGGLIVLFVVLFIMFAFFKHV